jgi:hypothetical protein
MSESAFKVSLGPLFRKSRKARSREQRGSVAEDVPPSCCAVPGSWLENAHAATEAALIEARRRARMNEGLER